MRFYRIDITDPAGKRPTTTYTSFINGRTDPGALNVLIDAYSLPFAVPAQFASVQVWGISEQDRSQAANFNGLSIAVYAGFQAGLPLAKPQQSGLIIAGTILQAFGNWQGTDMTLDFVITADAGTRGNPKNIVLNWKAGTTLASALGNTLLTAFPNAKQQISINPKLVLAHDETGYYATMTQFCQDLKVISSAAIGGTYPGVDIVLKDNVFVAFDGTTRTTPIALAFSDLMGQPTYIDTYIMQFMCPMRADLNVDDYIKMPAGLLDAPGAVINTPLQQPQARQKTAFQGVFQIIQVHHAGSFRQPDGQSWVTVFDAAVQ